MIFFRASPNPAILGHPVTLTADLGLSFVVTSPNDVRPLATGTVTFYDGASVLGRVAVGPATLISATLTTSLLPAGTRRVHAYYSGDANYSGSIAYYSLRVGSIGQTGFQAAATYGGVSFPRFIAVGDFNSDGRADLVIDDFDKNQVSVLIGNGDGTFQAPANYATQQAPGAIAVADFNGDGKTDFAVVNGGSGSNSISVFLNIGSGTFAAAVNYPVAANPHSIATADFNNDGIADLVVDNFSNNAVSVLLGNANGTFRTAVTYPVGIGPIFVAVGDFNGDGQADIAAANQTGSNVTVLFGNGDGTFRAGGNLPAGANPNSLAVADFNADGFSDLAVANGGSDNVSILISNGNGTFQAPVNYSAPRGLQSVAVGDFNGDGRVDLVTADASSGNVNVLLAKTDGTFQTPVSYSAGTSPLFTAVGDFNGDGLTDLAVPNFTTTNFTVLLGALSAGPHIIPGGAVGAGLSAGGVHTLSPNGIASVFGDSFAAAGTLKIVRAADFLNGRVPTLAGGVCVFVNNVAAPIFLVTPTQVNFQVPQIPSSGTAQVQVATACGTGNEIRTLSEPVAVAPTAPEFFYFTQAADGKNQIAAVNGVNGNYIGTRGLIAGLNFFPALEGDIILLFFTGGGTTNPAFAPGELPAGIANVTASYSIAIGGGTVPAVRLTTSDILYIGTTPGFPGLYQANIRIPAGVPAGVQRVVLTIDGVFSPFGYLAVGPLP
ncbi:MAG TPA: FG-GAP-like repeat-containing protein [Bryobacteraceae bacterium]|jgi:uncharacterized protein (TIGR03437 family)|nr:FG-GAP-like repeat-containing protein [Bryobacteraceae bacterium]